MTKQIRTYSKNDILVDETRNHIVQCASKVFIKNGFHQTSMRDVIEACGMSTGTLYRYVGSKEDILYLILQKTSSMDEKISKSDLNALGDVSWTETLRGYLEDYLRGVNDAQDWYMFNYTEMRHLPRSYRQSLIAAGERVVAFFERVLRRGIEAGEFEIDDPSLAAHNITVLCHSWAIRRWFLGKRYTLQEYTGKQTEYILRAIGLDTTSAVGTKPEIVGRDS